MISNKRQFAVLDLKTMGIPDVRNIALTEDWAKNLTHCDIDGFYLGEDGQLLLLDYSGHCSFCDNERFIVVMGETRNSLIPASDLKHYIGKPFWKHDLSDISKSTWSVASKNLTENPRLYGYGTMWVSFSRANV